MKIFLFACAFLWAALVRAETLTIATYNVENYNISDRMTAEGYREKYPKPEAEKTALRAVIRKMNADVVILEEMGPPPFLDELQRDLAREGVFYPNAFLLEGPDPDRHVAVIARRSWKAIKPHEDVEFSYDGKHEEMKRGVLELTFSIGGEDVTVWAVHLKSRLTGRLNDDPEAARWRDDEARAARDLILKEFPEPAAAKFLILGDFNDSPNSKALRYFLHRGEAEIASLLPASDSRGEVWTEFYAHEQVYSNFDHILVSPALRGAVKGGRAQIFDSPETARASDHRPVLMTLEISPPGKN